MSRLVVTYRIASYLPLEQAAEAIAGEQTTGTFVRIAGETDDLRSRYRARVLDVTPDPSWTAEPLPGAIRPVGSALSSGLVRIAYPLHNTGPSIARVLPVIAGNLSELRELAALKIEDVDFPEEFAAAYPGPRFGIAGTRELVGVRTGPMLGTIVKPNIGLTAAQYGSVVRELGVAGVDFIKDDEVNADCPPAPLAERVPAIIAALDDVEERTGRRPLYAVNISDEPDVMLGHHDLVVKAGGNAIMVNLNIVGLPAVVALARHSTLPIHGHMTGLGAIARHPGLGMAFTALQKFARLAGADHVHVGGFKSKFYVTDEETAGNVHDVLKPLLGGYNSLPVVSSAQWAGTAPIAWQHTNSDDLLVLAGGGMLGHPDGAAAGVASMRQAWAATMSGIALEDAATTRPELAAALRHFGPLLA